MAIIQVQLVAGVFVRDDDVEVTVPIEVGQGEPAAFVCLAPDIGTGDAVKRVCGSVVQIEPVPFQSIDGHQVQVAVAVHITERHRSSVVTIGGDIAPGHSGKRILAGTEAIVEVQAVPLAVDVSRHQVRVAVPVHVADGEAVRVVGVGRDVNAWLEGACPVVQVQPVALPARVPDHQVRESVPVHVCQYGVA